MASAASRPDSSPLLPDVDCPHVGQVPLSVPVVTPEPVEVVDPVVLPNPVPPVGVSMMLLLLS